MQTRRYLSPQQVAQALGVSETTVKRWVDDKWLPGQKTAGGHRRILVTDLLRVVREGNWPHIDLNSLANFLPSGNISDPCLLTQQFYATLVAGDLDSGRTLLVEAYQGGMRIEEMADLVIAPVMARVGHGWAEGTLDVFQEHRATQVCHAALQALRPLIPAAEKGERPLAVGGGPEFDHYFLTNLLMELLLQENGWQVVNIGPNTPLPSFRKALRALSPRLLWLSCSHLPDHELFLQGYQELYDEAHQADVAVAVGGQALLESVRARMRYTLFGDGLSQLGDFVRKLHPRTRGSRRGRAARPAEVKPPEGGQPGGERSAETPP